MHSLGNKHNNQFTTYMLVLLLHPQKILLHEVGERTHFTAFFLVSFLSESAADSTKGFDNALGTMSSKGFHNT